MEWRGVIRGMVCGDDGVDLFLLPLSSAVDGGGRTGSCGSNLLGGKKDRSAV